MKLVYSHSLFNYKYSIYIIVYIISTYATMSHLIQILLNIFSKKKILTSNMFHFLVIIFFSLVKVKGQRQPCIIHFPHVLIQQCWTQLISGMRYKERRLGVKAKQENTFMLQLINPRNPWQAQILDGTEIKPMLH